MSFRPARGDQHFRSGSVWPDPMDDGPRGAHFDEEIGIDLLFGAAVFFVAHVIQSFFGAWAGRNT